MARQALPRPRPGGKGCPKRLVLGKTMFGYRPVKGGGREPLQTIGVLTQVWISPYPPGKQPWMVRQWACPVGVSSRQYR